ncbi:hypothetical protein CHLRE_04g231810v5 [Chlamydomonas reinhardtii]|uniref:Uncharacterized protein n=1 Tax=Chlamydomonas reinhardtii TaxID=3055 RepID=A0A2K3DUZ9_CHLRE|nr:uncharacterized protein CHLRE_04g231810v5 [Chlamydomonas reinhardtii]PNW84355.1 hypothetical protein CHLRE_04g231810v5 [Chlamydomonas reinhardtii]
MFIAHGCGHGATDWWPQSESCPKCIGLPEEMNVTLHLLLRGYAAVAVSSTIADAEVVWQVPAADTRLRGVMFIAHGCGHGATDWWPQSESCPKCIGLPEEMNVTLHLLLRGYAAVAVSSADRTRSRCWQDSFGGGGGDWDYTLGAAPVDWMQVKRVLDTLLPREQLLLHPHHTPAPAAPAAATTTYTASGGGAAQPPVQPSSRPLPRYALGGSSGGGFVMGLPLVFPPGYWSGLVVQIAAAPSGLLTAHL